MKEAYEKIISKIMDGLCLLIVAFAILPIAVAQLFGIYLLHKFFELEGVVVEGYIFQVIGIGNICLLFIIYLFFIGIMESFIIELKKLYHQIKNRKKNTLGDKKHE